MKKPEKYLKDYIRPLDGVIELHTGDGPDIIQIIKQAQMDAWNSALDHVLSFHEKEQEKQQNISKFKK